MFFFTNYTLFLQIKRDFSIASCRDGDVFDGKTLSLCVRRAELFADSVSNYLCNVKAGDVVEISGLKIFFFKIMYLLFNNKTFFQTLLEIMEIFKNKIYLDNLNN